MTDTRPGTDDRPAVAWRPGRCRPVEWLLLTGNRLVVSGVLLLVVAVAVWGVVLTGLAPLDERTPTLYLLFALISGNFALITIVVSLSQFVLARHLESPDEIRERMNEMVGYRREVGETTRQPVLPITPSGFLLVLFRHIARQVDDLHRQAQSVADDAARREVEDLAAALGDHTAHVIDVLEESASGLEHALFVTLNASYAVYIYRTWVLESEREAVLPSETSALLGDIGDGLAQVDVARRFLKTVLIQSELATLSRLLLYIGVPVQLATVVIMLLFTATSGGATGPETLAIVIPLVVTIGFAPIVILTAFILRLATVAERTAAMYPFTNDPKGLEAGLDGYRADGVASRDGLRSPGESRAPKAAGTRDEPDASATAGSPDESGPRLGTDDGGSAGDT